MKKIILNTVLLLIVAFGFVSLGSCSSALEEDVSITGTLLYNDYYGCWEIDKPHEKSIDVVDIYVIKRYEITIPKDSSCVVQATGKCYKSQEQRTLPAGYTLFDLEVKDLIFK